ncbi:rhamnulokinase [Actinosynnema pretiosum]|uniref:Rhamnulokinase n=1 Tax=Actinosynnema pretiosum TaxID=42197 RepID=A0A290Z695_9PSEU|nr:rhamnulokinase family protein [Actinosynnema pretiosum]ATE54518.1 rhamnulokinase [Actinosynnema pretiosum]
MRVAAVDLGATSGRVVVGEVGGGRVGLTQVRRFPNGPVDGGGVLRWDTGALFAESVAGLRAAGRLDGIGIDSWAVDYGLLDADGALLRPPAHHRDGRTAGMPARVHALVPEAELYAVGGVQALPFTTVYQLAAETDLDRAATLLLIPDLLVHHLTGAVGAERTNASTTGLYDARAGEWALGVAERVGVPGRLLPPLRSPGEVLGTALGAPVVAVGSHDTASAVLGVPARPDRPFAYLSSGTWSLIGVELERPLLTEAARLGGFGNEAGVDGTTRLLRNVMGLWVLTEALRAWGSGDLAGALASAAHAPAFGPVVDVDAPEFLPPGDMPARIAAACRASGQREPGTRGEVVRCVLESLALAYRRALRGLERVTGTAVEVLHVVGGGARNELLCALTADACGVPVVAGPVEATALGNVLVQARALGADLPDRWAVRELVAASAAPRVHRPGDGRAWDALEARAGAAGVWG